MNKDFERWLIVVLVLILIGIGLSNCAKKEISTSSNTKLPDTVIEPTEEKPHTITDSIGKMQGVANALVCVFSPDTCDTVKQEREMDR